MKQFIRRRWLLFEVVACTLLTAGVYWFISPRPSITEETFAKIRPGMTPAEVEALIGGPAGDYTTGPCLRIGCAIGYGTCAYWVGDDGEIMVQFDDDGRVSQVRFGEVISTRPSFLDRLRAQFGW